MVCISTYDILTTPTAFVYTTAIPYFDVQSAGTGFDFTSVLLSTTGSRSIAPESVLTATPEQRSLPRKEIVHKPLNQVRGLLR
jgi:hypothetical protein